MATKIFDSEALVAGTVMESLTMTGVGNLVVDIEFDSVAPTRDLRGIKCYIQAWEGSNSPKPVIDGEYSGIVVERKNQYGARLNIKGVDAENCKLYIDVPSTVTAGTVTAEATGTTNDYTGVTAS